MPLLEANGASIHYQSVGDGPPLLLIAGLASDGASWRPLVPRLTGKFTVLLIDNRGSGRTRVAGDFSVNDVINDCVALLDHLGIARADILGHSLGGTIGMGLAEWHGPRVRRLVTLCATDRIRDKELGIFSALAARYLDGMAPQDYFRQLFPLLFSPDFFVSDNALSAAVEMSSAYPYRQTPADFARQVTAGGRFGGLNPSAIKSPTLSIAAERDVLVPPAAVLSGHAGIAELTTLVVAGAGHSVHWEAPEAVAAAVTGFLLD